MIVILIAYILLSIWIGNMVYHRDDISPQEMMDDCGVLFGLVAAIICLPYKIITFIRNLIFRKKKVEVIEDAENDRNWQED